MRDEREIIGPAVGARLIDQLQQTRIVLRRMHGIMPPQHDQEVPAPVAVIASRICITRSTLALLSLAKR